MRLCKGLNNFAQITFFNIIDERLFFFLYGFNHKQSLLLNVLNQYQCSVESFEQKAHPSLKNEIILQCFQQSFMWYTVLSLPLIIFAFLFYPAKYYFKTF